MKRLLAALALAILAVPAVAADLGSSDTHVERHSGYFDPA
jgi:hypothetical protein